VTTSASPSFTRQDDGCYQVHGNLGFDTVVSLHKQVDIMRHDAPEVRIDLQSVGRVDSAGLALMLDWVEQAAASHKTIRWLNIPDQMTRLIRVNRLEHVFE